MGDTTQLGKALIVAGVLIAIAGAALLAGGKIPAIGRLPGDIVIKRENFTFYFPLTTGIIISLLVTLLFRLMGKK